MIYIFLTEETDLPEMTNFKLSLKRIYLRNKTEVKMLTFILKTNFQNLLWE